MLIFNLRSMLSPRESTKKLFSESPTSRREGGEVGDYQAKIPYSNKSNIGWMDSLGHFPLSNFPNFPIATTFLRLPLLDI